MSASRTTATTASALWLAALIALGGCSSLPRDIVAPRVQMIGLSVIDASGTEQRFRVTLRLQNPNAVAIPIESLRFSARLAGQGVLMGDSAAPVTLPARGTETVRVEVRTDLVSSLSSLLAVVRGPEDALPYEINGDLSVGRSRQFPFSYRGDVPLTATLGTRR
jgi:LEA14-like dessication related protein